MKESWISPPKRRSRLWKLSPMPLRRTLLPSCRSRRLPRASRRCSDVLPSTQRWAQPAPSLPHSRTGERVKRGPKPSKAFRERPPVPPRRWNRSVPLYAGMWKERTGSSILLKVWTGTCWSWVKVRTFSRALPAGFEVGSPALVRKGRQWWLHTPIEKTFTSPPKIAEQLTTAETRICAVDLNLDEHLAVCTVQSVEGTILA